MHVALTIKKPRPRYSVEEYLALERAATERHEYLDGEIIAMAADTVAMAGEKLPHGIISMNVGISLGTQLKGTPCFAVTKDTKVRSGLGIASARSTRGMFSYPDILIICGEAQFFDEHHDVIMNPTAIVEVLSPSTESFDRGDKFQRYRAWNTTLQDYVLVSQTQPFVEHFHRQPDGTWSMQEASGLDAAVRLSSINCTLKLADVYDRIVFDDETVAEPLVAHGAHRNATRYNIFSKWTWCMPIFQITGDAIHKVNQTSFRAEGIREREDLQRLLRKQIDIIGDDMLIIAEEFGDWEDSKRRIDLLGVDRDAKLVVIELKRTEDGGHMELQAIRYAAMVSTMTFDKAVEVYPNFLEELGSDLDARSTMLEFLDWAEPNDEVFNKDVRIVLISAEFSKELTTAVLWLIERDIDIRCIRMKPYTHNAQVLVDVQPIIPLPEAAAYVTGVRLKSRKERVASVESAKDLTKYDVIINGVCEEGMAKRRAILRIVKHLCASGVTPEQIAELLPWRAMKRVFQSTEGTADSEKFVNEVGARANQEGQQFDARRYFCDQDDLIHCNGRTYAFTSQWGPRTAEAIGALLKTFPDKGIACKASDSI